MDSVGNKKLPNRQKIKKVKGRTYHLSLPTETTLNKLPKPQDLNPNQELFILVRSCPTETKIIWQDLQNNIHYTNIILPEDSYNLFSNFDQNFNYSIDQINQ